MDLKSIAENALLTWLKQDIIKYLSVNLLRGALSITNPLLGLFAGWIANIIVKYTEMGIQRLAQYVEAAVQDHEFKSAAEANFAAQQGGSDEDKKKAAQDLINHARSFGKFTTGVRIQTT